MFSPFGSLKHNFTHREYQQTANELPERHPTPSKPHRSTSASSLKETRIHWYRLE